VELWIHFVIDVVWKRRSTVGVTGPREDGDVRSCLLAAIMILGYIYKMHTYLRYA
jgi:hypothetical protein